ncbi:sulfite oxidase heme-binding subunit YedZ [Paracoccus aerodenitrificans]|uniref:sulfite oxidase heme-binding subunit YedZ n=1 Tax=Paracoccus aerodenitrificans TaxID=3017781 RepID=UPI0022F0AD12|nr:protein-methionine-sulfoxide reductase heme-binding subunit MsrQ [Paracoccus aerodenitrificans]WBU63595.1 sulfoxide reductase heme-binding subunit YedZ [Paracoccus aerodenitrificans]
MKRVNAFIGRIPEWAVWLAGSIPLALLTYDLFNGGLGVDPVRDIEHRLGRAALYFLIGTLAVTPARKMFRVNAIRLRRALGLLAFSYAFLHMLAWIFFDMGLLWQQMLGDVVKRPYLLFGMTGLVILLALAVTSNRASIRRLGRNWLRLHRLIYPAAILACLHWLWALKLWTGWPLICAGAILVLLLLRVPSITRKVSNISLKTVS